jgi:hypothetical protein
MKCNVAIMRKFGLVPAALFVFVLMLVQSLAAQDGAVFYVSTTGNDSNPGTLTAPWLTIQHAANTVTAGATVNVMGGVYTGFVNFPNSGTVSDPITFQSSPVVVGSIVQPAVIDGTGLTVSGTQGLITISGALSYITVKGFELRNLSSAKGVPCGVWITGSGTGVQILNNMIHNIVTTSKNGNACGLFAYGTSQTPIAQLVVSGNELFDLQTGESESMTLNGNVTGFQVTNNIVHDNSNIGIDIIGYEKTGPIGYDQAGWGVVSGNTVYNISGIANSGEDAEYDADGLYCDGCAYTTFERNVIMQVDYGIETTSENQVCQANGTQWSGPNNTGTAAKGTYPCYGMYATVRNNLFYNTNACGNSIGGYAVATTKGGGSNGGGSSFHDVFVNNTLFHNGIQPGNDDEGTPSGEFQIQNQVGSAQEDYFENNAVYAGWPNIWINDYASFTQAYPLSLTYPPPPATLNWNLYDSDAGYLQGTSIAWGGESPYTNFSNWQASSGEDANSQNADPQFVNMGATPPNLDTAPTSPAIAAGSTNLPCSVGWCDPNGSSPSSIYGSTDILGNPRTNGSKIDIGAYENNGDLLDNSLAVNLSSAESTLSGGQSTTLTVTVTAIPGGGGAPSGTVSIMKGKTLLETATLLPTGVNTTAATVPLSASQLAHGDNTLTAVYSGNSIAPCCTPSQPPGGTQTPTPWYPTATSPAITETSTATAAPKPTFNPGTGNYTSVQTVIISDTATGGAIYYTTDGKKPSTGSTLYSGPITVSATETVKAIASTSDSSTSGVVSAVYTLQLPQTITFTPSSVTYGASPIALSATGGASGNPVTFTYISGPGTLSGPNNSILTITGAGAIRVTANQAGNSTYAAAPTVTASIAVTRAVLTVTANNLSKAAGAANPTLTVSYSGFQYTDGPGVLSGSPSLSTTATTSSPAGVYPIKVTQGTLSAANYTFAFVNGTLSVVAAPTAVITTSAVVTGSHSAGYSVAVRVANSGTGAASKVTLTSATLGTTNGSPVPQSVATLAAGASTTFTVSVPGSAGLDGAGVAEKYTGTYTGGSFSASVRSVTLP